MIKGQAAFHAADYSKAVHQFRHAAVDDPQNPRLLLLLSQSLLATGRFDEAAGAAQAAMRHLPKDQWGSVVTRYAELYGRPEDYTSHLRSLEAAIRERPKDPALRFLIAYHYSYLGFRKEALEQLDRVAIELPRDEIARDLRKLTRDALTRTVQARVTEQQ